MATVRIKEVKSIPASTPARIRGQFFSPALVSDADKMNFHINRIENDLEKLKTITNPADEKAQINTIADNFSDSGKIIHDIGFLMGGKSGGKMMKVGSALASISTSIGSFGPAATTLSMAGGVTGIAVGAFAIAMVLFDEEDEGITAHQQIMEALYGLARMIEKGFNMVLERQAFTSLQISQLSSQVNRVEKLLGVAARDSYLQGYLTLTIKLNHYLYGRGVKVDTAEIAKDLRDLESWIVPEGHAYKPIVTGTMLIGDRFDPSYHLGILGHRDFDNASMMGYMSSLLEQFAPTRLADPMKLKLPNLRILIEATMLYKNIVEKLHPPGNVAPLFAGVSRQWKAVADYVSALNVNSVLWDSLCMQVNAYARQANQYLAFLELGNKFTAAEGTISSLLPEGVDRTKLITILDHLEVRRLLMIRFLEILGKPETLKDKIAILPSKSAFLARTRASLREANVKLLAAGAKSDVSGVRAALESGANYNSIVIYPTSLATGEEKNSFVIRKRALEVFDQCFPIAK